MKFLWETKAAKNMKFEIEMSAFQFLNNKIIDIGMPKDAKLASWTEVRNLGRLSFKCLDFDEDDMRTYNYKILICNIN